MHACMHAWTKIRMIAYSRYTREERKAKENYIVNTRSLSPSWIYYRIIPSWQNTFTLNSSSDHQKYLRVIFSLSTSANIRREPSTILGDEWRATAPRGVVRKHVVVPLSHGAGTDGLSTQKYRNNCFFFLQAMYFSPHSFEECRHLNKDVKIIVGRGKCEVLHDYSRRTYPTFFGVCASRSVDHGDKLDWKVCYVSVMQTFPKVEYMLWAVLVPTRTIISTSSAP